MRAKRRAPTMAGPAAAATGVGPARARALVAGGGRGRAERELDTVLSGHPDRAGAWQLKGLRRREQGRLEAADRDCPHRRGQGPLAAPPARSAPRPAQAPGRGRLSGGQARAALPAWGLAFLVVIGLASGRLHAETWTTGGLSFSDELGGARLLAASGSGTANDPIVLVEEITGPGPAILAVRNGRSGHLNVSPAIGFLTLSIVNVIVNRGPWRWAGFDLELRTTPDQPSVYTDGLSFDQPQTFQRLAKADRFQQTWQEDEPFDRIRFDGGGVDPRDDLRLAFDILDANGRAVFYLVQRPIVLLAGNGLPPGPRLAALDQERVARTSLR